MTTLYASITVTTGLLQDVDNSGTSSTAADIVELRMGSSTYNPDRHEVLKALKRFERWVVMGGLDSLGTNIPLPSGAA